MKSRSVELVLLKPRLVSMTSQLVDDQKAWRWQWSGFEAWKDVGKQNGEVCVSRQWPKVLGLTVPINAVQRVYFYLRCSHHEELQRKAKGTVLDCDWLDTFEVISRPGRIEQRSRGLRRCSSNPSSAWRCLRPPSAQAASTKEQIKRFSSFRKVRTSSCQKLTPMNTPVLETSDKTHYITTSLNIHQNWTKTCSEEKGLHFTRNDTI